MTLKARDRPVRKAYAAPTLRRFGRISDLTLAGLTGTVESVKKSGGCQTVINRKSCN